MTYYVLIVFSGVEADVRGPFEEHSQRDRAAREIAESSDFRADYDSIFPMDVENGVPKIYSFTDEELYVEAAVTGNVRLEQPEHL